MSKPNILYLHCHDAGRWLQPYAPGFPTPNLDRLAKQSTLFRNAHCANPTCSPSRASLLTGQWPHQQMFGLAHLGFSLNKPEHHVANYLKEHGYRTALCGVQHEFGASMEGWPYDEQHQPTESQYHEFNYDGDVAELASNFLSTTKEDGPFFLACGFFYPHREFPKQHGIDPNYLSPPDILPDTKEVRLDLADYHAAVQEMDRSAGRVLDALEANGLAENTIVVFTTDHGPAFPFMKCTLKDAGTGVALMIREPDQQAGQVSDALVSHIDVFPTLCDLLELPQPEWLEGQSLSPVLRGSQQEVREELFSEVNYHAAYEPKRAIRTHSHKLIVNYDYGHSEYPMSNIDPGHTKSVLLKYQLSEQTRPSIELYDLMLDPAERDNLAESANQSAIKQELLQKLEAWQRDTNDPITSGSIDAPSGARITPHKQLDY